MFLGKKIDKTRTDSQLRPFLPHKKFFYKAYSMVVVCPPISKVLGTPLSLSIYIYIYIRTNDWTMPGGATTCLNTTIFKSNVFCVLYAIQ